jgi:hypothetical protein
MPLQVPRFRNFRGTIFQHAAQAGRTMSEEGRLGGRASARARSLLAERRNVMKELQADDARRAAEERRLAYATEDTGTEIPRLQALGHMKQSYVSGFLAKMAKPIDRTRTTSELKPSILYNRRSMKIRMTKGAGMLDEAGTMDINSGRGGRVAQGPDMGAPAPQKKSKTGVMGIINNPGVQSLDDIFYIVRDLVEKGAV